MSPADPASDFAARRLAPEEALRLPPGAAHYRAFIGPPDRFDFMSGTQFNLLFCLGLREGHRVLDFGCGSLRLGRLLIPYLRKGGYFGIDPNRWLIEDGIAGELGNDIVALKAPRFSFNDDFDCAVFDTAFHFIMAQSILTHAGPDLTARLLHSFRSVMEADGICLFTYRHAESGKADHPDGWHYPQVIFYEHAEIERLVAAAGLTGRRLRWYHPGGATWFFAARSADRVPSDGEIDLLTGAVIGDPRFPASG